MRHDLVIFVVFVVRCRKEKHESKWVAKQELEGLACYSAMTWFTAAGRDHRTLERKLASSCQRRGSGSLNKIVLNIMNRQSSTERQRSDVRVYLHLFLAVMTSVASLRAKLRPSTRYNGSSLHPH
jgi:hypothetical protein